jgi:hypothetical protein
MARKRTCAVCDGDHFKRVIVTLPSGRDRDTDFVSVMPPLARREFQAPSVDGLEVVELDLLEILLSA